MKDETISTVEFFQPSTPSRSIGVEGRGGPCVVDPGLLRRSCSVGRTSEVGFPGSFDRLEKRTKKRTLESDGL